MKFCASCGTAIEEAEPVKSESSPVADASAVLEGVKKQAVKAQKFIKPAIFVVAAVVIVAVLANVIKPAKYEKVKGGVNMVQSDDRVAFYKNGKNTGYVDGYYQNLIYSLNSSKMAALISEDIGGGSDGYSLYLIDAKAELIDEEVYKCWISASGNAVAYVKEFDYSEDTAELWLHKGGKETLITSELLRDSACFVSPNGGTVCYTAVNDDDEHIGIVWDGKENELGENYTPVAVADGMKYVYYTNDNGVLYVQKGKNSENRERLGETYSSGISVNRDLSQIVFSSVSETYISRNGGEKEELSGNVMIFIFPDGTAARRNDDGIQLYGISNFANTFYQGYEGIVYINGKYEANSVVRGAENVMLADDGKTLTYIRNGDIYKVNGMSKNAEPEEIVSNDAERFTAVSNGSAVFFVNEDDELYYQKGKGKPVLISEDVEFGQYGSAQGSLFKGDTLFYISDDELYFSSGGKGKAVSGIEGDVSYVGAGVSGVTVYADDGGDSLRYFSGDGKKFTLLE
jgi:hypothetical protein